MATKDSPKCIKVTSFPSVQILETVLQHISRFSTGVERLIIAESLTHYTKLLWLQYIWTDTPLMHSQHAVISPAELYTTLK